MTASLLPNAKLQFIDINGAPLVDGTVWYTIPGTNTAKDTWQDSAQTILNDNPLMLDERGQAIVWGTGAYRQRVYDVDGNLIWDQITALQSDLTASLHVYPTFAAAAAALAAFQLIDGDPVEVEVDETHGLDRTRYEVVSGELVLITTLPAALDGRPIFYDERGARFTWSYAGEDAEPQAMILPHLYVDPFSGNDANDGLTLATAFRTNAGLMTSSLMGEAGTLGSPTIVRNITVGIVGHATQVIRDSFDYFNQSVLNGYRQMHACAFVRVGANPVKGDCTKIASPGAFTPYAPVASSYQISWTSQLLSGVVSRFRVFINGKPLARVSAAGSVTAGTYYYSGNPVFGVATNIIIKDFDSSNPSTNGKTVEITYYDSFITMRGGLVQGVFGYKPGHNSGSIINARDQGQTGDPSQLRGVLGYEGNKHNLLFGYGSHYDVIAVNSRDGDYDPAGEVPSLMVAAQYDFGDEATYMTRCSAFADETLYPGVPVGQDTCGPFLLHDSIGGGGSLLSMTDCGAVDLASGWAVDLPDTVSIKGHYSPGLTSTGSVTHVSAGAAALTVARSYLGGSGGVYRWITGTNVIADSNLFISDQTFSGGGISTINLTGNYTIRNNMFVTPGQPAPSIDMLTGNLTTERNLFAMGSAPIGLSSASASPSPMPTIQSDYGVFQGDGGNNYYIGYLNVNYTLANWVTFSTEDDNTTAATSATDAGFVGGAYPVAGAIDVRITAGSKMNVRMTDPITQAEIEQMQARPITLAAAEAYLLNAPSLIPVLTA